VIETTLISDFEPSFSNEIKTHIAAWEHELRSLLQVLPDIVHVEIIESRASSEQTSTDENWSFGVNGSTPTHNTVRIEINTKEQAEQAKLMGKIKETVFHEFVHVARGYSFESVGLTLLAVALEEGLATKFEILKAEANPWYGQYGDKETMLAILEEVRNADQQVDKDWQRWKFYDPDTDRHWILYRLGAFIVDEALANNPELEMQNLIQLSYDEILELSDL
jgi:hypothetical protein